MRPLDRRLLRAAPSTRPFLILTLLLAAASVVALIVQASALAAVVARGFVDGAGLAELTGALAAVAAAFLARAVIAWLTATAAAYAAARGKSELRRRAVGAVSRLGPADLARRDAGAVAATLTSGVDALDGYLAGYLPALATCLVVPPAILVWSLPLDLTSTVVLAVTLPLVPVFMVLVGVAARRSTQRRWDALQRLSGHFVDVLRGLGVLRLYGRAQDQSATVRRAADALRRETMGTLRVAFLSALVLELLAMLGTATVAVLLGVRLVAGAVALEPALAVLLLAPEAYLPLRRLGSQFHAQQDAQAASDALFELIEADPGDLAGSLPAPALARAHVRVEDVTVVKPHRTRPVLDRVSVTLPTRGHVAVVGASGAGKTTLAAVLLGFEQPHHGRVVVATPGAPPVTLADVRPADWRRQIAWVGHRPALVHGTVAANLRPAAPQADAVTSASPQADAALVAAARVAGVHEVVAGLPAGYDTVIGPGGRQLSAGERQRIALARAVLSGAPMVVLDEPTADLDPASEVRVRAALRDLARDRTVVSLTHRLAVAADADKVVVLAGGRVVEHGPPDTLRRRGGAYAALVAADAEVAA